MPEVYLSPHLDDAVLSCGGRLLKQLSGGQLVISIFTGGHNSRKEEEKRTSKIAGYDHMFLDLDDAPLRSKKYRSLLGRHGRLSSSDKITHKRLVEKLNSTLEDIKYDRCYIPLGIGNHVDHIITFNTATQVVPRDKLFFYEDSPYCLVKYQTDVRLGKLASFKEPSWYSQWSGMKKFFHQHPYLNKTLSKTPCWKAGLSMLSLFYVICHRLSQLKNTWDIEPVIENIHDFSEKKFKLTKCYESQWEALFGDESYYKKVTEDYLGAGCERYWRIKK